MDRELIKLVCLVNLSTSLEVGREYLGYKVDGGYRIPTSYNTIGIYYSDHRFKVVHPAPPTTEGWTL